MSNRAGLKHDFTRSIVHLTFDRGRLKTLSLWKLSKHCGKSNHWSHHAPYFCYERILTSLNIAPCLRNQKCHINYIFMILCEEHLSASSVLSRRTHSLYLTWTGIVRASSLFPILSTILLMLGGLCVGIGRIYRNKNNILLSAGILFVAAGRTRLTVPCTPTHELAGQQIYLVQTHTQRQKTDSLWRLL